MKHLFLVRHAKSSWADEQLEDHQRPLNKRGKAQLEVMARPLVDAGAFAGSVYASDAVRARETAEGLVRGTGPAQNDNHDAITIRFSPALYTFSSIVLADWLRDYPGDEDTLTLIGHNPALLDLAGYLLKHPPDSLPTGSFIQIRLPITSWRKLAKHKGKLARFLTPKEVSFDQFKRKRKAVAESDTRPLAQHIPVALEHQYEWIRDLEPGVILGYDEEFLHQYRIGLRRSRAVAESVLDITGDISLAKAVKSLKRHARATGPLRDLDVLLADLRHWWETDTFEGLEALSPEAHFRSLAQEQHEHLKRHLNSERYRDDMRSWQRLITSRHFRKMTNHLATDDIRKALHQRISRHNTLMAALTAQSPDDEVHRLRKLLKRIRYLAELDKAAFRGMRKELKERQQLFGTFQDLHIQIELLTGFQSGPAAAHAAHGKPAAALARLIATLEERKTATRHQILTLGDIDEREALGR